MTAPFTAGQGVRYVGAMPEIAGKVGTFAWLRDYDLDEGAELRWVPGFIDADGFCYYVEPDELETPSPDPARGDDR